MSKPIKKQVPKAVARKKGKYKNQDKNRWRKVAAWVVPFVTVPIYFTVTAQGVSGVWLAVFTWIAFFLYLTLMIEWLVWRESSQRKLLRVVCALFCVAIGGFGFIWAGRTPQPFLVTAAAKVGSYKHERGGVFWARYNSKYGDTVSPAQLGVYIEIINLQSIPAVINAYTVEAKNLESNWFKLTRVESRGGDVYFCFQGGDLHHAKPLDLLENGLDRVLESKAIPAHGTVWGWAFFELPQEIRDDSPFRITVEDNTGMAATQITAGSKGPVTPEKDYLQGAPLHLAAGEADLTKCYFTMFSEINK
jgi:hypothetical protein